ncbi:MAG: tRNA (N(6)-L-threonylcarbamoyladenosine(37)-C(2))-methylthiotransferase MtaB [Clostridia bacterium]|nr:tRNA (N(6)-L-threonylcarbamoyladenosine(37)-C(2))-methylthiotransferase MtaB [Clostridia bacterium]
MALTVGICTLGCKVNYYESECIRGMLEKEGFIVRDFSEACDVYVINSCTVTAEGDRKVMQACRRAVKTNPDAFICVTGCTAQIAPEKLAAIKGIGYICGNRSKKTVVDKIKEYAAGNFPPSDGPEIDVSEFGKTAVYEPLKLTSTAHTRAVIKIEDGCNSSCAYCIIHTARGPARSRPEKDVLEEAERIAAAGYKEVILTGIELSSYSGDLPELVKKTGEIPGIERIRLGSLDPYYITKERIIKFSAAPKLMPHFHISLQSGSSRVLAAMRRKYNAKTALERIMFLKETFPAACLFADIIVGFPGETEEDFNETVEFIKKVRFLHLHIFPFSKRAGTTAASMPGQISTEEKRSRAAKLAAIQREIKKELLEEVVRQGNDGRILNVLFEEGGTGHSEEFIEVKKAKAGYGPAPGALTEKGAVTPCRPLYTDGDVIYVLPCESISSQRN